MRVISGTARGMKLTAPRGRNTRPTSDRVREALFNLIGGAVPGSRVLDLFAGTGALAIEALSRGATDAVLVDHSHQAIQAIRENLNKTSFSASAVVRRLKLPAGLSQLRDGPFDLIFVDPPYQTDLLEKTLTCIDRLNLVTDHGLVIAEHDAKQEILSRFMNFQRLTTRSYGDTSLTIFEAEWHEPNGQQGE